MTPQPASLEPEDQAAMFARLRSAVELQRAGHPQQAEVIYHDILARTPGQPDALHMLGLAAFHRGEHGRAIEFIRQAIANAPEFPDAHNSLGIVLKRVGETEEAIESYRRAVALRPAYPEAHHNLAIALESLDRTEEAEESVMARLGLVPDDASAQVDLGYLLHKKGRVEEAIAAFQRAVDLQPDNVNARRNLWVSYYRAQRFDDALQALRNWKEYDPGHPVAEHMLAAFGGSETPARASDAYVQQVFERMAADFDQHLATLGYRAPELVARALASVAGPPAGALDILDAGCGTGLCGPLLRDHARRLVGVDLSQHMLAQAEDRGYDELATAELTAFLLQHPAAWDAIISADTLCYFGDLVPVLRAAEGALGQRGWLIFTVEKSNDSEKDFTLSRHGRYSHTEAYVRQSVIEAGLELRALGFEALRQEGGQRVAGLVVTAAKGDMEPPTA